MSENVKLNEGFTQVVVWPGTPLGDHKPQDVVDFIKENFGVRIQYLEQILTNPDRDSRGEVVPETGGREDMFFAVHDEDSGKFAIPKLHIGARWLEDVYLNGGGYLYPERVAAYKCWDEPETRADDFEDDFDDEN